MPSSSNVHDVYILRCNDDSLYVGEASDIELRLGRHSEGRGGVFTARRLPVALVYTEAHADIHSAVQRERQLKRWTRAKKEALIANDFALLKRL